MAVDENALDAERADLIKANGRYLATGLATGNGWCGYAAALSKGLWGILYLILARFSFRYFAPLCSDLPEPKSE